ncbi:MAG: CARDB domain-containing protein, partial [Candidatus Poseidoniaceae archaeon]|nr:CARDB domain-containing protein [Candidatus Poseidoniaceae archaeon]
TSITLDDDHISPGSNVEVKVEVINNGGESSTPFSVAFYAGDSNKPFDSKSINSLEPGQSVELIVIWEAEAGVDRIRAVVDPENVVIEVNEDDNSAEHSVEVVYVSYFGWVDNVREQPLGWVFAGVGVIVVMTAFTISRRTALERGSSMLDDDYYEDDDYEDMDEDDDDDDWEDDDY